MVLLSEDGYYHVGSVNGPLLLADMLSGTQWNNSDLYNTVNIRYLLQIQS